MKFRTKILLLTITLIGAGIQTSYAQLEIPGKPTIYNDSQSQYLQANNLDNPIRDGAYAAMKNPDGEGNPEANKIIGIEGVESPILSHQDAKVKTLKLVGNVVNYALSLVSLVALIYLIYHGFIVMTAAGDDGKYKEGLKGIKYATIALVGIGFSRILIYTIFMVVNTFVNNKNTKDLGRIETQIEQRA